MEKLLPEKAEEKFNGYKFTEIAFLVLTIITIIRSLIHVFAPDGGAESIATINLDMEGAHTIISMFALWGASQLLMGIFYVIVYAKYKNLIPLMYIFIMMEYSMRILIGLLKPIETTGTAPGAIGNVIIVPIAIFLLIFSLLNPKKSES